MKKRPCYREQIAINQYLYSVESLEWSTIWFFMTARSVIGGDGEFISLMVDGQSRPESDDSDMYSDGSVE